METVLKFFPFLPEPKDTGKLVLAILFYFLGVPVVCGIIGFVLGLTIILSPIALLVGAVGGVYSLAGTVFAILKYCNVDLTGSKKDA